MWTCRRTTKASRPRYRSSARTRQHLQHFHHIYRRPMPRPMGFREWPPEIVIQKVRPENVTITFTDAAGLRWQRTGYREPVRLIPPSPEVLK